jgi:hypothetical protein
MFSTPSVKTLSAIANLYLVSNISEQYLGILWAIKTDAHTK